MSQSNQEDFAGADLGGTKAKFYRTEEREVEYPPSSDGAAFPSYGTADDVKKFLQEQLANLTREGSRQLTAVGVALPCTMVRPRSNPRDGRHIPSNVSKFQELAGSVLKLEKQLKWKGGPQVCILNDGEAAARSAYAYVTEKSRNQQKPANVLVVTLGTSIGVGFVFNGEPYDGPYPSRASHMILDPDGEWCVGENHWGCWKTLAGSTARLLLAKNMGLVLGKDKKEGKKERKKGEGLTSEEIFGFWKAKNDHRAKLFFDFYADRVAQGIANIVSVVPVECVIVAGGVSRATDLLEPLLEARMKKGDILDHAVAANLEIRFAPNASVAHGAKLYAEARTKTKKPQ